MAHLLAQLLSESARRTPEAEALSLRDRRLTYRELDEASNRLARTLQSAGVRRCDRVALYLDKSVEAYIAIFGVLKADAAYVPLDPQAPVVRLAYIVANSDARAIVSAANKASRLPEVLGTESEGRVEAVVFLDEPGEVELPGVCVVKAKDVEAASREAVEQRNTESDLAYILYTSGSTGEPKGVMISHRNALCFVDWACDCFGLTQGDRVSNHAPLHFDLSVFDVFATVKAGATICPVPAETARFPVELGRLIEREKISVWYSVPSALMLLVQRGALDKLDLSALRAVLFAGEAYPTKHLRALMEALPGARFYNLYGPTETNVITWYEVPSPPADDAPIPIGRACANMEVFALGEDGRVVTDPGVVGELYARSPTVAQGYCGDAEKTARLFLPNPLRPEAPERVYRTGDLVRLDEAGDYHFLGRSDHQVKVQGYRIELGEVETALMAHPAVDEAVVLTATDAAGSAYLRAVVVLQGGVEAGVEELKRHCAGRLPAYMIPSVVELRESLPRTSTGKTDRVALAAEGKIEA